MKRFLKVRSILILVLGLLTQALFAQLTINVTSVPANTPADDDIFIAGNFNGWNPGNTAYKLTDNNDGTYTIVFTPSVGNLEFKFTRGSWATVEGTAQGQFMPNRTLYYGGGPQTEDLTIAGWEGNGGGSTLAENAYILSEDFEMPQLDRTRRIWLYLPPDYESTDKTYPVLYMHDGQNLFDETTSFSGEWEVDESLNELFDNGDEGVIVIGIDNGGVHRLDEYSPWVNAQYGGGEGDEYVDFIVETLKPFIDASFRTKSDRDNTGIMGSSMGGLISMYAAVEHQDVFSKAGIFSPSFWFSSEVYTHVENTGKQYDMKFYMLGGEQESASLIQQMETMENTLQEAGFDDSEIILVTHSDGQHSEWYWRREFPDAYAWLFSEVINALPFVSAKDEVKIGPNPFSDSLFFATDLPLNDVTVNLYNLSGEKVNTRIISFGETVDFSAIKDGLYLLEIVSGQEVILLRKVIKSGN
jgi:predicted alpha/beta superfamily hydrolase